MTRRPIALILLSLFFLFSFVGEGVACFGPKLYLGTEKGAESDLLFEAVSLYLKEKTGTETVRVYIEGDAPRAAVPKERVDLALVAGAAEGDVLLPPRRAAETRPRQGPRIGPRSRLRTRPDDDAAEKQYPPPSPSSRLLPEGEGGEN